MSPDPLLLILLDACRYDYPDPGDSPFLWGAGEEGLYVQRLRPGYGFCEIAEMLTGVEARRSGLFCQMGYFEDAEISPALRLAVALAAPLEERGGPFLRECGRSLLRRVARRFDRREVYQIPARQLHRFGPTEAAREYREPLAFGIPSLLDLLREAGGRADTGAFVTRGRIDGPDEDRVRRLEELANGKEPLPDLTLAYLGNLDAAGHRYGPEAEGLRASLRATDRRLARSARAFLDRGANVLVVGDHGMMRVHARADPLRAFAEACRALSWKAGREAFAFVDSTLCRFWVREAGDLPALEAELEARLPRCWGASPPKGLVLPEPYPGAPEPEAGVPSPGFWLREEAAERLGAPRGDRRYGDLAWGARPGILFAPDYFNLGPVAGMHGYRSDLPEQQGLLLGLGPSFPVERRTSCSLVDVAPTAAGLLGLSFPGELDGRNLRGDRALLFEVVRG